MRSLKSNLNKIDIWKNLLSKKKQWAKKAVSDSPGPVDFAIGLVNSTLNLLTSKLVKFFEELKLPYIKTVYINPAHPKVFGIGWNEFWA